MMKKTYLDEVCRRLKAKTKSKSSQKSADVLARDRAELARLIYIDLTKHVFAFYGPGDGTFLERLAMVHREPLVAFHARGGLEDAEVLLKIFDEMLQDGFEPTVKEDFTSLLNWCHCFWLYYSFISPKMPPGIVTEKLSLAFAKVVREASLALWAINKQGKAIPGIEARRDGKGAAAGKRMAAVLLAFAKIGDVSGKSKNKIAHDVLGFLSKEDKCDVKTILEHLKKGGKI
jgi:hypothetical protein